MSISFKSLQETFRKRKETVSRNKYQLKAFGKLSEENKKHSVDRLRHSVDRLRASNYHNNPYFTGLTESYWD